MDFAYWLQIAIQVGSLAAFGGIIYEKVRQIEKRLGSNGSSIPSRCREHTVKLEEHERRLKAFE